MPQKRFPKIVADMMKFSAGSKTRRPDTMLIDAGYNLVQKRDEDEKLKILLRQKEADLETWRAVVDRLQHDEQDEDFSDLRVQYMESNYQLLQKAEREALENQELENEYKTILKQLSDLKQSKQELQREVDRLSVYSDMMDDVVNLTPFTNKDSLTDHFENLLEYTAELCEKEMADQDKMNQMRKKTQRLLEDQSFRQLTYRHQLAVLQTEFKKKLSEHHVWEKKWTRILDTSAMKTLQLGQIKMAVLNIYEITGGVVNEEQNIGLNDTEKQLEFIKLWMLDNEGVLKIYRQMLKEAEEAKIASQLEAELFLMEETLEHAHLPQIERQTHTAVKPCPPQPPSITGTDPKPQPPPRLNQASSKNARRNSTHHRDAVKESVRTPHPPNAPSANIKKDINDGFTPWEMQGRKRKSFLK